jgi:hypothetical protein
MFELLGERTIGRPRYRWEENIHMDIKYNMRMQTGFVWLRKGTRGGLL